jgi:hypothetical protein
MTIALGLLLAIASAVAINGGYALQHAAASALPPLSLRRPLASLLALARARRWLVGFLGGVGAALIGLALLGLSLASHTSSSRGSTTAVVVWMLASAAVAPLVIRLLPAGAGFGTAAGVLYAAGDVGTKAAVFGGPRLWFVPALLACHGLAFVCMQLAFQRGGRLTTAGLAVLWTNALPIVAGSAVFAEGLPDGWRGALRLAAFVLVLIGAVGLSRAAEPAAAAA